ncbi:hypothetical protein [Crassaminicella profunda]|uniref:hypothetical protein n=1 Tax=Crassaminicella profunda TaxID=1286698 RepID=UPI001CA78BA1|nr:hypothetical protein [Crassaminicella profunda]QZY56479.1 hypothetical protein K7H06_06015 [Crassaminicella profunda]
MYVGIAPIKTKNVGKIYLEQMYIQGSKKWILSRISPKCENCNSNKHYDVICTSKLFIIVIPYDKAYKIVCPKCGETIGLDFEEYLLIEPFIKLNKKYEEGKISHQEYEDRITKISDKLKYSKK